MEQDIETRTPAFVGVAFHSKVIFNIVENDGAFNSTGMSVINHLKQNKNKFVAKIIESQSYNSIKYIFDDEIRFSEFYDLTNENREEFGDIISLINNASCYEHFYIFDLDSDTLVVKIPERDEIFAIDYKNSEDVRDIINSIN